MELDVLIMSSSRPQLFPYCWESFKKYFHFEGKLNVYFHEDFVFPSKSEELVKLLEDKNIEVHTHNPAIGLGKSMNYMFQNHCKSKYLFYLQED